MLVLQLRQNIWPPILQPFCNEESLWTKPGFSEVEPIIYFRYFACWATDSAFMTLQLALLDVKIPHLVIPAQTKGCGLTSSIFSLVLWKFLQMWRIDFWGLLHSKRMRIAKSCSRKLKLCGKQPKPWYNFSLFDAGEFSSYQSIMQM